MLIAAFAVAHEVLSWRPASFHIDDESVFGQELVGYLHCRSHVSAKVAAKVDDEILKVVLRELCQGDEQFGISVFRKLLYLYVARLAVEHVGGGNALLRYLSSGDGHIPHLLGLVAEQSEFHLCVLRAFQSPHGFRGGDNLSHERLVVDADNLVARYHSSLFRRSVANDVLHVYGVLSDGEFDAHSGEGAAKVVVGRLHVL